MSTYDLKKLGVQLYKAVIRNLPRCLFIFIYFSLKGACAQPALGAVHGLINKLNSDLFFCLEADLHPGPPKRNN